MPHPAPPPTGNRRLVVKARAVKRTRSFQVTPRRSTRLLAGGDRYLLIKQPHNRGA